MPPLSMSIRAVGGHEQDVYYVRVSPSGGGTPTPTPTACPTARPQLQRRQQQQLTPTPTATATATATPTATPTATATATATPLQLQRLLRLQLQPHQRQQRPLLPGPRQRQDPGQRRGRAPRHSQAVGARRCQRGDRLSARRKSCSSAMRGVAVRPKYRGEPPGHTRPATAKKYRFQSCYQRLAEYLSTTLLFWIRETRPCGD